MNTVEVVIRNVLNFEEARKTAYGSASKETAKRAIEDMKFYRDVINRELEAWIEDAETTK